jgi:hypothetical protein
MRLRSALALTILVSATARAAQLPEPQLPAQCSFEVSPFARARARLLKHGLLDEKESHLFQVTRHYYVIHDDPIRDPGMYKGTVRVLERHGLKLVATRDYDSEHGVEDESGQLIGRVTLSHMSDFTPVISYGYETPPPMTLRDYWFGWGAVGSGISGDENAAVLVAGKQLLVVVYSRVYDRCHPFRCW